MNKKKNMLIKYKAVLLSGFLATTLSINSTSAPIIDSNYRKRVLNNFYVAGSQAFEIELNKAIYDVKENWKPENLDFSDFPYRDGSKESMLEVARYVRDKVKFIPNSYKYNYVLEHFMFSPEDFDTFYAVIYLEGVPNDGAYELAFANTTNVFNRVISYYKSKMVKNSMNTEDSVSLYQTIIAPSQYSPYGTGKNYGKGDYLNYIGFRDEVTYQAVLDSLFVMDVVPERMHDFLDFRATKYMDDCVQIVNGGNWFRNVLQEDDIIPLEERYYYVEEVISNENMLTRHLG